MTIEKRLAYLVKHNIKIIDENELAFAFYDGFAVTQYPKLNEIKSYEVP